MSAEHGPRHNPKFIKIVEEHAGMPVDRIRRTDLDESRRLAEEKHGTTTTCKPNPDLLPPPEPLLDYPSHEEVEKDLDKALK